MRLAAIALSLLVFFALGCMQTNAGAERALPSAPAQPGASAMAPSEAPPAPPSGSGAQAPSAPPAPPSASPAQRPPPQPEPPPATQPPSPQQNNSPSAPLREPVVKIATLQVGQSLDFGEGRLALDDVWIYHPTEPALASIYYPDGRKNISVQMFPDTESRFIARSGTPYWIALGDTQAGIDIYVKRVKFYIFEARDNDSRFDRKLYSGIVSARDDLSANPSSLFGKEVAYGVLARNRTLGGNGSYVRFDDMDREPASEKPALATVLSPPTVPSAYVKLGSGQAYVYRGADGKLMAAYNEVAFTAANGSRYAFMRLYEAGQSAVENRTYNALFPLNSTRPAGGYKVGAYSLAGAAVADTEKQLHLRLAEAQSVAPGADGVVVEFLDTDDFYLSSGMARSDRPLYYTGTDGKRYSIWLDSASTDTDGVTHAQLSMYRIG